MSEPVLILTVNYATDKTKSAPKLKVNETSGSRLTTEAANTTSQHQVDPTRLPKWLATPSHQSQSFFQRYGSNLPTSLTYTIPRPEAFHLGDLMRLFVRLKLMAYARLNFQGTTQHISTQQMLLCSSNPHALSPNDSIPRTLKIVNKKRKLFTNHVLPYSVSRSVTAY